MILLGTGIFAMIYVAKLQLFSDIHKFLSKNRSNKLKFLPITANLSPLTVTKSGKSTMSKTLCLCFKPGGIGVWLNFRWLV